MGEFVDTEFWNALGCCKWLSDVLDSCYGSTENLSFVECWLICSVLCPCYIPPFTWDLLYGFLLHVLLKLRKIRHWLTDWLADRKEDLSPLGEVVLSLQKQMEEQRKKGRMGQMPRRPDSSPPGHFWIYLAYGKIFLSDPFSSRSLDTSFALSYFGQFDTNLYFASLLFDLF